MSLTAAAEASIKAVFPAAAAVEVEKETFCASLNSSDFSDFAGDFSDSSRDIFETSWYKNDGCQQQQEEAKTKDNNNAAAAAAATATTTSLSSCALGKTTSVLAASSSRRTNNNNVEQDEEDSLSPQELSNKDTDDDDNVLYYTVGGCSTTTANNCTVSLSLMTIKKKHHASALIKTQHDTQATMQSTTAMMMMEQEDDDDEKDDDAFSSTSSSSCNNSSHLSQQQQGEEEKNGRHHHRNHHHQHHSNKSNNNNNNNHNKQTCDRKDFKLQDDDDDDEADCKSAVIVENDSVCSSRHDRDHKDVSVSMALDDVLLGPLHNKNNHKRYACNDEHDDDDEDDDDDGAISALIVENNSISSSMHDRDHEDVSVSMALDDVLLGPLHSHHHNAAYTDDGQDEDDQSTYSTFGDFHLTDGGAGGGGGNNRVDGGASVTSHTEGSFDVFGATATATATSDHGPASSKGALSCSSGGRSERSFDPFGGGGGGGAKKKQSSSRKKNNGKNLLSNVESGIEDGGDSLEAFFREVNEYQQQNQELELEDNNNHTNNSEREADDYFFRHHGGGANASVSIRAQDATDTDYTFGHSSSAVLPVMTMLGMYDTPQPSSDSGWPFKELYRLRGVLGNGAYATVREAYHRSNTLKSYAVKCINRNKLTEDEEASLLDEITILKELRSHPHIIHLYDIFEEPNHYYLIMERMRGGELFDRVVTKSCYTEKEARDTCQLLLLAVQHMHDNHIAHRDLKPENLLLCSEHDDSAVKIADFGFAKKVYERNSLRTQVGTPGYVAPEILSHTPYDERADMWSVGVILFILLGGYPPFSSPNGCERELYRKIRRAEYDFDPQYWSCVSTEAKELISQLLCVDTNQRLQADEALESDWMTKLDPVALQQRDLGSTIQKMLNFNGKRKLRAAVSTILAIQRMQAFQQAFSSAVAAGENDEEGKEEEEETAPPPTPSALVFELLEQQKQSLHDV